MKKLKERSDWFKGLLYAEQMYKDGYDFSKLYGYELVKFYFDGKEKVSVNSTIQFTRGIKDYAAFILKIPE